MTDAKKIDPEHCEVMAKLVEDLTTTGKPVLDEKQMKAFKKICKKSDEYVKHAYHLLITQLEKNHSEVRLSCFLMIDELFQRSHCFREELLGDFHFFLMLVAETEIDVPLPPPKGAAKMLKSKSLETIQTWHEKFSGVYKKLALGFNYLQHCKKVDFNDIRARNIAERQREEEQHRKQEEQRKERIENTARELFEGKVEIEAVITQLENCLQLLLPELDVFNLHGLASPEYRPNYNPFRVRSRRSSSTKATPETFVDDDSKSAKITKTWANPASESQKNCRRKSSSTTNSSADNSTECAIDKTNTNSSTKRTADSTCPENVEAGKEHTLHTEKPTQGSKMENQTKLLRLGSRSDSEEEDNIEEMSEDEDDFEPLGLFERESGLGSKKYSLDIDLNAVTEVTETSDNTDILGTMKDLNRELVKKWLPAIGKWLEVLTKNGADKEKILKAIDLKRHVTKVTEKVSKVKAVKAPRLTLEKPSVSVESKGDSDSDFEEVPEKEGFEPRIADHLREEYGLLNKAPKPSTSKDWKLEETTAEYNSVADPSSYQATLKKLETEMKNSPATKLLVKDDANPSTSGTSRKKPRDPSVPTLPFGTDLLHWGEDKMEIPLVVKYESDLKGWIPKGDGEDVVDLNALESMRSRIINYEGNFVPVKWKCRAPLTNGKLCLRMDRAKCPFHGKIIARDDEGKPTDPKDIERLAKQEAQKTEGDVVDWEDTELQAEIEAQTGKQLLRRGKKKGEGRSKKYPGLTDISPTKNSCRKRLERKVLSAKAMKRVAASMDRIRDRKIQDKFGNNYVYAIPQK